MEQQEQFAFAIDSASALEVLISKLLWGTGGALPLAPKERELLAVLRYHKGVANARKLEELAEKLQVTPREVKQLAKDLTQRYGVPIGALRQPPYGYFLCVTPEDYAAACRPYLNEVLSLLQRLKALSLDPRLLELYGRLQREIEKERGIESCG